ncbi:23S rRNA (uracil(1939)-C(5))-methyltransferase RlmD [Abyssicoccus albus]|uniref:23S rRNA m(5)U-1939 methyltransferase n=1 Tax=Abyssicoccus albus TaxID=1817405 RepID=A0A3N5BCG1_9BACL|nr:23S rRNA (uracil(1939)-C(5))-methyltransferase RlmD [Abyssicoccus albus]RPF55143.1 23S rRNA m(5)U-1939 methyltransferase [Abyssicoccus albus]
MTQNTKNKPVTITIKRLGINGEGIGYYKKKIAFVKGALPGEVIRGEVEFEKDKFMSVKMTKVLEKSSDRIEPPCPVYEECGGCQLQHLKYPAQLSEKVGIIKDALTRYAPKVKFDIIEPMKGMTEPFRYRNKLQFPIKQMNTGRVISGMYAEGSHQLIDLKDCIVQQKETMTLHLKIKRLIEDLNIPVGMSSKKHGLTHIIIRQNHNNEMQVGLMGNSKEVKKLDLIASKIMDIDKVISVSYVYKDFDDSVITGHSMKLLKGKKTMEMSIGDKLFDVELESFYQLNDAMVKDLYDTIKDHLNDIKSDQEMKILDAYCGAGTIGIYVQDEGMHITGVDDSEASIRSAKINQQKNNIQNIEFIHADAKDYITSNHLDYDCMMFDPPRTGINRHIVDTLLTKGSDHIIYTSCNPSTFAKDIAHLSSRYHVTRITPVDMFPQTSRIELVATLERKKK